MSVPFPPLILTHDGLDIAVSGRTLTPEGVILAGYGFLTPNATRASITLTGASEGATYDLAILALEGNTYGLTTYAQGGTPVGIGGVWYIGTVVDYPTEGRCQVLLSSAVAFQSDQYVQIESDGIHVKPGGQNGYGGLTIESPGHTSDVVIVSEGFSSSVEAGQDLTLGSAGGAASLRAPFSVTVNSSGANVTIEGHTGTTVKADTGTLTLDAPTITATNPFTAASWVNATYAGTWATVSGGVALAYRLVTPTTQVQVRGAVTGGAATNICAALPSAYRPVTTKPLTAMYWNGTVWAPEVVYILSDGVIYAPNRASGVGAGIISINAIYPVD